MRSISLSQKLLGTTSSPRDHNIIAGWMGSWRATRPRMSDHHPLTLLKYHRLDRMLRNL